MVVSLALVEGLCGNNHSSRPRPPPQNVRNLRYVILSDELAQVLIVTHTDELCMTQVIGAGVAECPLWPIALIGQFAGVATD